MEIERDPNTIPGYWIHNTNNLNVIGYADTFDSNAVPSRVAPIFLLSDRDSVLAPPFRLLGDLVIKKDDGLDPGTFPYSHFKTNFLDRSATRLRESLQAIPNGMLWVDELLDTHYGPQEEENRKLRDLAMTKLRKSYDLIKSGKFEDALRESRWAAAADESSLMAVVLQAAVYKIRGSRESNGAIELLKRRSMSRTDHAFFDEAVEEIVKSFQK